MKKFIYLCLLTFVSLFSVCQTARAQQINAIQSNCPSGNALPQNFVRARADGNIWYVPCDALASVFFGNVDFTNATVTGVITGSGTANYIPRFTASSTLGNTPFSWDGTNYVWNNTALNSQFTIDFLPSSSVGRFRIGDFTTTPTNYFDLEQSANSATIQAGLIRLNGKNGVNNFYLDDDNSLIFGEATSSITFSQESGASGIEIAGLTTLGDVLSAGNDTIFSINDGTNTFLFENATDTAIFNLTGIQDFQLQRTVTANGTTGDIEINKPFGTVNFAATADVLIVTNSVALENSIIFCTIQNEDATARSCRITNKDSGSFRIK